MHAKFTTLLATATIRDLALLTDTRRVPVVDRDGRLLGVVA